MAFYEELDMAHNERTQNLPFVKGDGAKFRHYAGVPLNPYGGPNIGTVFIFSEKPSVATHSAGIRSYLTEAADHITKHLEQAVEALEGKRALRFNRGVASLLNLSSGNLNLGCSQTSFLNFERERRHLSPNLYRDGSSYVYHLAATLLCDIFEFNGVKIQRVGVSRNNVDADERSNNSEVIAQHFQSKTQDPGDPPEALLGRLLGMFPQGVVFHIAAESGEITTATVGQSTAIQNNDNLFVELSNIFPNVEQMIMMPLWEAHYERNIGVVLGFANRRSRVHLSTNDLSSMSAFCTTIMAQVQRLEVQAIDQIKSDFLGSVSHEMRTPLHGILSSLELLADIPCDEYQRDLLKMAQYSGSSLLDTIDRVLYFSGVSTEMQLSGERPIKQLSGRLAPRSPLLFQQTAASFSKDELSGIIHVCESYLRHAVQRLHLKRTVRPELFKRSKRASTIHNSPAPVLEELCSVAPHPIIFFDTNATWSYSLTAIVNFKTVYTNLLVCREPS
jgi:signal transduction histidine kinase